MKMMEQILTIDFVCHLITIMEIFCIAKSGILLEYITKHEHRSVNKNIQNAFLLLNKVKVHTCIKTRD